jgi:hypothetical protein
VRSSFRFTLNVAVVMPCVNAIMPRFPVQTNARLDLSDHRKVLHDLADQIMASHAEPKHRAAVDLSVSSASDKQKASATASARGAQAPTENYVIPVAGLKPLVRCLLHLVCGFKLKTMAQLRFPLVP